MSKIVIMLFIFCLFIRPSYASLSYENKDLNFTVIEITPPYDLYFTEFLNKPEKWNNIFNNPSLMSEYTVVSRPSIEEILDYNIIKSKSISEIANMFKAGVYLNKPEYACAHIGVPIETYENFTRLLKAMGFNINENILKHPLLNESVYSMSLPYQYGGSDLTGRGIRIAIIDSGIDSSFLNSANQSAHL